MGSAAADRDARAGEQVRLAHFALVDTRAHRSIAGERGLAAGATLGALTGQPIGS
jgi:hypothetical protein